MTGLKRLFWAGLAFVLGVGSGLVTFALMGWVWVLFVIAVYFAVFGVFLGGLCHAAAEAENALPEGNVRRSLISDAERRGGDR
jgi:hypothetical protein